MPVDSHISDSVTGQQARVTNFGELVVGKLDFSTPVFKIIGTNDQVVNFFKPQSSKIIIITDIIIYANRNVGVNDSTVILYEADDDIEAYSAQTVLHEVQMLKQSDHILTGLNWKVTEGKFLNATADDDDVFITIAGYYAPSQANLAVPQ